MKKIVYTMALLFGCIFMVAFSPADLDSTYNDITQSTVNESANELGSFVQSEESHETADRNVWRKRHKEWTEILASNLIANIEPIIDRN